MSVSLNNFIKECSNQFPDNLPKKACQGFLVTTAISLFNGATLQVTLIGGAIAIIASVIEAVTRSIIQASFKEQELPKQFLSSSFLMFTIIKLPLTAKNLLGIHFKCTHIIISFLGHFILNTDLNLEPGRKKDAFAFAFVFS